MKTVDKLSKGKSNFEILLASQNCVFGKYELGFNPHSKKSGVSKPYSTIKQKQPIKNLKQAVVSCFYRMKKGHSVRFCKIRNFFVPNCVMKRIPKDPNDSVNANGPKFVRGPNLAT